MKTNLLNRIVAVLLVPCIVASPATPRVFDSSHIPGGEVIIKQNFFESQAFASRATMFIHRQELHVPFYILTRWFGQFTADELGSSNTMEPSHGVPVSLIIVSREMQLVQRYAANEQRLALGRELILRLHQRGQDAALRQYLDSLAGSNAAAPAATSVMSGQSPEQSNPIPSSTELLNSLEFERDAILENLTILIASALEPLRNVVLTVERIQEYLIPIEGFIFTGVDALRLMEIYLAVLQNNLENYKALRQNEDPTSGLCKTLKDVLLLAFRHLGFSPESPDNPWSPDVHDYITVEGIALDAAAGQFIPQYRRHVAIAPVQEYQTLIKTALDEANSRWLVMVLAKWTHSVENQFMTLRQELAPYINAGHSLTIAQPELKRIPQRTEKGPSTVPPAVPASPLQPLKNNPDSLQSSGEGESVTRADNLAPAKKLPQFGSLASYQDLRDLFLLDFSWPPDVPTTQPSDKGPTNKPNLPSILGSKLSYALSAPFWEWLIAVPVLGSLLDAALLIRRATLEGRGLTGSEIINRVVFLAVGIFWRHAAIFADSNGFLFATLVWIICSAVMMNEAHPEKTESERSQLLGQGLVFHSILFFPIIFSAYLPSAWLHLVSIPGSLLGGIPSFFF